MKFFRKYHKWVGIVLSFFILLFAISGVVLNHRKMFSGSDISRSILAQEYQYINWNNASIKGSLKLNSDSVLVYGNVGVWLSDSAFVRYKKFNQGFPKGIDNRKVFKLHKADNGKILAGTLFGVFELNNQTQRWHKTNFEDITVMDFANKQDTLIILTRSNLYKSVDLNHFEKTTLPEPTNYNNKVSLFKTLWTIHSGEILGHAGKLFTDFMALVFIFLSITGFIYFLAPHIIKRKKKRQKSVAKIVSVNRFSLKWHNKLGWILLVFLVITTITGMFLRPPLLIAIMNGQVSKIPGTILNTPNPWFDKLRRVIYDEKTDSYTIATIDGVFSNNGALNEKMIPARTQPPISVMGVNVFEQLTPGHFLVGSFEGLFIWNKKSGKVWDFIEEKPYKKTKQRGAPIGKHMIAGYTNDFSKGPIYYDYNTGAWPLLHKNTIRKMPVNIKDHRMSLWNFALEIHTMRIFQSLIGMLYLLIIPLTGLGILFILISGFIVWYKVHRKKKKKTKS